jgi:hypothetical protein
VRIFCLIAIALSTAALQAAPAIFPLKDIRAGQHGVGRTVFNGTKIEQFQVEILGVLHNIGPRESIILAKLSGGPLAETGVIQGMSGSPVYIDGKLVGAVALGFPLSKEAIAGIRPIEDMLRAGAATKQVASVPRKREALAGNARLEEIATPVSFSGFTAATLDHFGKQLRDLGLDPRQGVSGGGDPPDALGNPKSIEPGSMISVQLLSGDMSMGADGTVTYVDGDHIYAFGHRFLDEGATEMPFARSEVLALLPNLSASFKISTAREWMGAITEDRNQAISGWMGKRAGTVPIDIRVGANPYHMRMIQDRVMTPLVMQMAIFSALDETERGIGPSTVSIRGHIDFDGGTVGVDNIYSGDVNTPTLAAIGVTTPLTYALSSGFDGLKLKNVALDIAEVNRRDQLQIADMIAPREVRTGDDVEVMLTLAGENGAETVKKIRYRVPVGAQPGTLYFTAADATTTNMTEFQAAAAAPMHSATQILALLNHLHGNTKTYIRVWRPEQAFTLDGRDLPSPPPSLSMMLTRMQGGTVTNWRGSTLAEIEVPSGDRVVTGSKTIQVEVKE